MSVKVWQIDGTLAKAEREAIVLALEATGNNVSDAARRLRIGRSTLYRLMQRFDLQLTSERSHSGQRRDGVEVLAAVGRGTEKKHRIVQIDGNWFITRDG